MTDGFFRLDAYGRRAFSVAGPAVWNSLPDPGPGDQHGAFQKCIINVFVRSMLVHPAKKSDFTECFTDIYRYFYTVLSPSLYLFFRISLRPLPMLLLQKSRYINPLTYLPVAS